MNYKILSGTIRKDYCNIHTHKDYEIIYYPTGTGYNNFEGRLNPVKKNTILIVPPNTPHGSLSYDNLSFISVLVNKDDLIHLDRPTLLTDNEKEEGFHLTEMLLLNRFGNADYLNALCVAYIHFVLKNINFSNPIEKTVNAIKQKISTEFHDSNFNVTYILNDSGYAEDYIRAHFKKITGKTPVELLNEIRIKHAETLINIYQNSIPLSEIAERCGFEDYIYFSRKFKSVIGVSPQNYRNSLLIEDKN